MHEDSPIPTNDSRDAARLRLAQARLQALEATLKRKGRVARRKRVERYRRAVEALAKRLGEIGGTAGSKSLEEDGLRPGENPPSGWDESAHFGT